MTEDYCREGARFESRRTPKIFIISFLSFFLSSDHVKGIFLRDHSIVYSQVFQSCRAKNHAYFNVLQQALLWF